MTISHEYMIQLFREKLNEIVMKIIPCGNHELHRNLVYIVETVKSKYIIKFYYKKEKRNREIHALSYLKNFPLKILSKGEKENGIEWMIYNHLPGVLLDSEFENLKKDNREEIFFQLGKEVKKIHSVESFSFFGDWAKGKQSHIDYYLDYMACEIQRISLNIEEQNLPHKPLLKKSIVKLNHYFKDLKPIKKAELWHRDLDGRNILIQKNEKNHDYELTAILDFEKCVVGDSSLDIVNLYRKYFLKNPELIPSFFKGYTMDSPIDPLFYANLKFNLFFLGVQLSSWTWDFSSDYFFEAVEFLKQMNTIDDYDLYDQFIFNMKMTVDR